MKPYNKLTEEDKQSIVKEYYNLVPFKDMSEQLSISERAVARVLKEDGINTRLKNRYTLNPDYFETIDTEEKAYWLGFIYADGYVGDEKTNNIVISLTESDKEHLESFAKCIDYTGIVRIGGKGGFEGSKNRCTINFSNKKMASDLRKLGLYPGKSTTMSSIPDIQEELLRHFIRGYFDGDGSVYTARSTSYHKGKMYEYQKATVTMIGTKSFIKSIAEKRNYLHRIRPSKTKEMVYLEYYGVNDMKTISDDFYNDATIYLKRKDDKFTDILGPYSK